MLIGEPFKLKFRLDGINGVYSMFIVVFSFYRGVCAEQLNDKKLMFFSVAQGGKLEIFVLEGI